MNWLAHLLVSNDNDELLLGALLGDFLKGISLSAFSEHIQKGIKLHKKVDEYADKHPIFIQSARRILEQDNSRFAHVLVDIFYDHFLAKNWEQYSKEGLTDFVHHFYEVLEQHAGILPERLLAIMPFMIAEDWLGSYKELSGIEKSLLRMERRISEPDFKEKGMQDLRANYQALESDFKAYFPCLLQFVATIKHELAI